ncbi:MAG: hypothetical protein GY719_04735 [bacterium]|nr:hypothetical protein [bacterium]
MRRKTVTRRLDTIRKLRAMIRFSGDDLVHRLSRRAAAAVRESSPYRPVLEHFDAELATVERALGPAEDAYDRDKARLGGLRQQRNDAASKLRDEYKRLHRLLRAVVEPELLTGAGITCPPPAGTAVLARHVECTAHVLRDLDRAGQWPLARIGLPVALAAESLESGARQLTEAGRDLDRGVVAADISRNLADEAATRADRVVPWIARALASLWRLVGEDGYADRIRVR